MPLTSYKLPRPHHWTGTAMLLPPIWSISATHILISPAEARDWTERWPHSAPILAAGINIREDPAPAERRTWTQSPTSNHNLVTQPRWACWATVRGWRRPVFIRRNAANLSPTTLMEAEAGEALLNIACTGDRMEWRFYWQEMTVLFITFGTHSHNHCTLFSGCMFSLQLLEVWHLPWSPH